MYSAVSISRTEKNNIYSASCIYWCFTVALLWNNGELINFLSFQLLLPLKTQEDLDQAVLTLGCSSGINGLLRILLKTPKNNHVSFLTPCTPWRHEVGHWRDLKRKNLLPCLLILMQSALFTQQHFNTIYRKPYRHTEIHQCVNHNNCVGKPCYLLNCTDCINAAVL